jgi:hypothetical protein
MWICRTAILCLLLHSQIDQTVCSPTIPVVQLTGTTQLDYHAHNLREGVSHLASLSQTGLVLAGLVTGFVYLASLAFPATARLYGTRKGPVLARRISRILSYVSANSLDDLIDTIKPAVGTLDILPDISRMGTGAIESVGSITDSLGRVVSDKKIKDCLLQAICYLTPEDNGEEGEGRKNKEKQDRREKEKKEKQRRKKLKKKNKKKTKEQNEEAETSIDDDDYDEEVNNIEIDSDDCEVFKCDIVSYGYSAYQVFQKVRNIKNRLDHLEQE